jgi:hypothetical protein
VDQAGLVNFILHPDSELLAHIGGDASRAVGLADGEHRRRLAVYDNRLT